MSSLSLGEQLPKRPGYGKKGRKVILWANYLDVKATKGDVTLFRYSVAFQGQDDLPKPKKKRLVQLLLKEKCFQGIISASDWAQLIVTTAQVKLSGTRQAFKIEWYPEDGEPIPVATPDEDSKRTEARKRSTFTLLVEEIGSVSVGELMKDLGSNSMTYPLKLETIQALNVVMGYGPSTAAKMAATAQNKFYPVVGHPQFVSRDLGGGLEALRGYFSSVRTSVNRVLLNVNVATGAFYKHGPLLDMLSAFGPPQSEAEWRRMNSFVRKLRFETNYLPSDKKGKDGLPSRNGRSTLLAICHHTKRLRKM